MVSYNKWHKKESLLDHVYTNNITLIYEVYPYIPLFGDHTLVIVNVNTLKCNESRNLIKRNWSKYTTELMRANLSCNVLNMSPINVDCSVQSLWNNLENMLVKMIDYCTPLVTFTIKNTTQSKQTLPRSFKTKINLRRCV